MDINASIIDQRLGGIQEKIRERVQSELNISDSGGLKSLAFVYLCVKTVLDLDPEEAFDCLTEGAGDFGIDALHSTEILDGEFAVTLFQAKYKTKLEGDSNHKENGINALINAINTILDPDAELQTVNHRLKIKVEAVRSLIRDGAIPRIRALACNNGPMWNATAQEAMDRMGRQDTVSWEHVNNNTLIDMLRKFTPVNETLRFTGKAVVEDMNYSRVCIGRLPVTEIAMLMQNHGDRLLQRNIRRYLGLQWNRVNEAIRSTLYSKNPANVYFFHNGLTLTCDKFDYNASQSDNYHVRVRNLQIVNGGQTCITISRTLEEMHASQPSQIPTDASVLVRLYQLPDDADDLIPQITQATNSQNPVDLKDLRSNDEIQKRLGDDIEGLGYTYRRKRLDTPTKPTEITSGTAAEAVLAVWCHAPHQAKFRTREHFDKLYETIFTDKLNGAQTIIAALLYRIAENHRKRPRETDQPFIPYASCFIAMQMGNHLLKDLKAPLTSLDHRNFPAAKQLVETNGEAYFLAAAEEVQIALYDLYGNRDVSLQQLSATFRRGDLIQRLIAMNAQ